MMQEQESDSNCNRKRVRMTEGERIKEIENMGFTVMKKSDLFKMTSTKDAHSTVSAATVESKHRGSKVLISGGWDSNTTEIYDCSDGSIRKGPEMTIARRCHASVTLPNGSIAVFGGDYGIRDGRDTFFSGCEMLDFESNSFSRIGNMLRPRSGHTAVLLRSGRVFIAGGGHQLFELWGSCEIYDPVEDTFTACNSKLTVGRVGHTATLLPDGTVLVCGGINKNCEMEKTTEIYDPETDSFSAGPLMLEERGFHTATALANGTVLLAGAVSFNPSATTEFYDPTSRSFHKGPDMTSARMFHFAALLPNGNVMVGGGSKEHIKQSTDIYNPYTNSFTAGITLLDKRNRAAASPF